MIEFGVFACEWVVIVIGGRDRRCAGSCPRSVEIRHYHWSLRSVLMLLLLLLLWR